MAEKQRKGYVSVTGDLREYEGYAVKITSASDGTMGLQGAVLIALPNFKTDLIGVVLIGSGGSDISYMNSTVALLESYKGTCDVALNATPGTLNVGIPMTITADGTWKAAASGDTAYARIVNRQSLPGLIEVEFIAPLAVTA